jgi:hypothetical protein
VNRTLSSAQAAAALVDVARVGSLDDVTAAELLLNSTSVGLGSDESPIGPHLLRPELAVADNVYHPLETVLLQAARATGAPTVDGLGMLVHHAVLQQRLWTGLSVDPGTMRVAAERELAARPAGPLPCWGSFGSIVPTSGRALCPWGLVMDGTVRVRTVVGCAVAAFTGLVVALVVLWAMQADAAPGEVDSTFVSIAPCRLFDTRPAPDRVGSIATLGTDTVTVQATGTNGNCSLPSGAVGVSLNVTAVLATAPTDVRVWGSGDPPLVSSLNPVPGQVVFNAVTTPLSGSGSFNIKNFQGAVDVIVDVNGYSTKSSLRELDARMTALETAGVPDDVLDRLIALEAENATLKAKTAAMSSMVVDGQPTVRFSGVNVQVVSGSGATGGVINGTGNLIVGYNENVADSRTGSHNLVVGPFHTYTSSGGLIAGANNTVSGNSSSVAGGNVNTASGTYSSVSGGASNIASGAYSSVSGGYQNTASDFFTSVSGGKENTASGSTSSVSGGLQNTASGAYESVAGGDGFVCFDDSMILQAVACVEGVLTAVD